MGEQTPVYITHPDAERAETYRKRREAAALRRKGLRWDDVAEQAGYPSKQAAQSAVSALLREERALAYKEVADYRQEQLDRYTELLASQWRWAVEGDEKAARECRLILERMDKILGVEAPVKHEIGESDVDRLLRDALEEFRRRTGGADRQARTGPGDPAPDR